MATRDDSTRILISREAAQRLSKMVSRRTFLAMTGGVAATAALAACGSDDDSTSGSTAGPGTTGAAGTATVPGTGTADTTAESAAASDFDKTLNMFTWAEYDDLDLLAKWGDIKLTIYDSNEQAIQKLVQGGGSSGFDMVVPTGVYIPQLVAEGLLKELDTSRIPNFANLDPIYANQEWDPGNKYSVCKNWGSTGWIYDTTVVTTEIKTWADFIEAAQGEASGRTSMLDSPPDLTGIYFWANGIDWTTEDPADLDACEDFLVNEFASHIAAFDSYPGINLTSGTYALSQVFNGDARQGLIGVQESGGDVEQYKWGLGAPDTELWMDNWCILEEAQNVDAAYDFINFILDPANSLTDLEFHGYNTGVKGVAELAGDVLFKDMIFFTEEQVATMHPYALNSSQDRIVEIYSNVKAEAGA